MVKSSFSAANAPIPELSITALIATLTDLKRNFLMLISFSFFLKLSAFIAAGAISAAGRTPIFSLFNNIAQCGGKRK